MTTKKKKKLDRIPSVDWNAFIVEWNALFHAGGSMRQACQRFGVTRSALTVRCCTMAKAGIYLPRLAGQRKLRHKKWKRGAAKHGSAKVFPVILSKTFAAKKTPKMFADMGSAGMVVRLMPVGN